MGLASPLKIMSMESSMISRPRSSGSGMALPLRKIMTERAYQVFQSVSAMCSPAGVNHSISPISDSPPCSGAPAKKRRRWKIGWLWCSSMSFWVKFRRDCSAGSRSQSIQVSSLSWQYPLLLPPCVRPISSPWEIIGTPWDRTSVVRKLRCWRARSALTALSFVSPSTPQFHERLWLSPSWLFSPFASLCFSLYETRSRSVNPSWAVTKLMEATGRRPECS